MAINSSPKTFKPAKKLLMAIVAFTCMLSLASLQSNSAYAKTPATDPVETYCLSIVKDSDVRPACHDQDNIDHALNAASNDCKDGSKSDKEDCKIKKVEAFFKQTQNEKPTPTTEQGFSDRLSRITNYTVVFKTTSADTCGAPDKNPAKLSISIGCKGKGNPITDAMFAIIRFLSNGVGIVIVGSLIVAGIQYASSRDEPQSVALATKRIQSTLIALLLYIFSYAILNYLIPAGFLGQ